MPQQSQKTKIYDPCKTETMSTNKCWRKIDTRPFYSKVTKKISKPKPYQAIIRWHTNSHFRAHDNFHVKMMSQINLKTKNLQWVICSWMQLKSEVEAALPVKVQTWIQKSFKNHNWPPTFRKVVSTWTWMRTRSSTLVNTNGFPSNTA